jgi:hypothetical protein
MTLDELEKKYEFATERDSKNKDIEYIKFKDGREYKLQHPRFFELHDAILEGETGMLQLALKNLYPLNDKSPRINEDYLNNNKVEGINLWSRLLRGLLSQPDP